MPFRGVGVLRSVASYLGSVVGSTKETTGISFRGFANSAQNKASQNNGLTFKRTHKNLSRAWFTIVGS